MEVKFVQCTTETLPDEINNGYIYITTDNNGLYIDLGDIRHQIVPQVESSEA